MRKELVARRIGPGLYEYYPAEVTQDTDGRRYELGVVNVSPDLVIYSTVPIQEPRTIAKSKLEEKVN